MNNKKYFVGFNGKWAIYGTTDYKINSFGEYVTSNGNFEKCFDDVESAKMSIADREKGYVQVIQDKQMELNIEGFGNFYPTDFENNSVLTNSIWNDLENDKDKERLFYKIENQIPFNEEVIFKSSMGRSKVFVTYKEYQG